MPHQRPTCLIRDPLETDMPHWRPTCPIGDRHAPSKTDMPHWRPTCLWTPIGDQHACGVQSEFKHKIHLNILIFIYFLLIYIHTCRYPMGCRSGMAVSNWSCRFQIGSSMKNVEVSDGSPIGLRSGMLVSDQVCRSPIRHNGLQSGMSVSDQPCRSLIGLQ